MLNTIRMMTTYYPQSRQDFDTEPFNSITRTFLLAVASGSLSDHPTLDCPTIDDLMLSAVDPTANRKVGANAGRCTLRYLRIANATLWGRGPASWWDLRVSRMEVKFWAVDEELNEVSQASFFADILIRFFN